MANRPVEARVSRNTIARDLAAFGPDAAKRLAAMEDALTAETIRRARAIAARVGRQQAHAAGTLRKPSRGAGAVLPAQPAWNAGAEFGAIRYPQFPRFRGSGAKAGYFLFPALSQVNMLQRSSDELAALCEEFNRGR